MPRRTMITPIGFHPERVLPSIEELRPDHVVILHTGHARARAATKKATAALEELGITFEDIEVPKAFDFVSWAKALDAAVERNRRDDLIMNLTPSHGIAVSMAGFVAAKRGLPAVVYDTEGTGLHHVSPAVVYHLDDLGETDRAVLTVLRYGKRNVSQVQEETKIDLSTVSIALKRLHERGFLARRKEGRTVHYALHKGVEEAYDSMF